MFRSGDGFWLSLPTTEVSARLAPVFFDSWGHAAAQAKEILFQSRFVSARKRESCFVNMVVHARGSKRNDGGLRANLNEPRFISVAFKMGRSSAARDASSPPRIRNVPLAITWLLPIQAAITAIAKLEGKGLPKRMAGVEQALKRNEK